MSTIKKRINLSIGSDIEKMLSILAKRDSVPQATKATELLRTALEIEEDQVWAQVAGSRDKKGAHFVSHEKAWA
ncbi:MAG: hypothetical protein UY07_C0007G0038 [Parcubacteria group bacterium GW2011_GWA1_47_8]|nr:MAG: hypothetical protein UY07_C0007G0038 [Parcubacteria group bacterium GW2011_GWA1_47_8]KKW07648.1 MAG: hypothetical protein UY42_C0009G0021 [Parcubacteria group bacterium GW2011_GWA2_49_16]